MDYIQFAILVAGLGVISVFGFYALKILANFKTGMLERGWKQVAVGAVSLILAQLLIILSQINVAGLTYPLMIIGSALRLVAMIFLILGLREHYLVWRVDKSRSVSVEN